MKIYRGMITSAVLVLIVAVLTGCEWFKPVTCPTCKPQIEEQAAKPEDVLLTIDGRPALTKEGFEEFYQLVAASSGPYGAPAKNEVFKQVEAMVVLDHQMAASGKSKTEEYRKELARAYDHARWGLNTQMLAKELTDEIDVSEAALTKFYGEQVGKSPFDKHPFVKGQDSIQIKSIEFPTKEAAEAFLEKAQKDFEGSAAAEGLTIKDEGKVSADSQNVDFAIRLKARTIKPGMVELAQSADKFYVIKAGPKEEAQYASFEEIKELPQMLEMLGQYKRQTELEPAFMKRIDEYKKGMKLAVDEEYFKTDEEERKAQEEQLMKLFQQQMQAQQGEEQDEDEDNDKEALTSASTVIAT